MLAGVPEILRARGVGPAPSPRSQIRNPPMAQKLIRWVNVMASMSRFMAPILLVVRPFVRSGEKDGRPQAPAEVTQTAGGQPGNAGRQCPVERYGCSRTRAFPNETRATRLVIARQSVADIAAARGLARLALSPRGPASARTAQNRARPSGRAGPSDRFGEDNLIIGSTAQIIAGVEELARDRALIDDRDGRRLAHPRYGRLSRHGAPDIAGARRECEFMAKAPPALRASIVDVWLTRIPIGKLTS